MGSTSLFLCSNDILRLEERRGKSSCAIRCELVTLLYCRRLIIVCSRKRPWYATDTNTEEGLSSFFVKKQMSRWGEL
jgi:hypothetical protein